MPYSQKGSLMVAVSARVPSTGTNDGRDGDLVLGAEFEIAFVVRGDGHDGAGAVTHENEVADPDGHLGAVERMQRVLAGELTEFLHVAGFLARGEIDHLFELELFGFVGDELFKQWMFGRKNEASCAVDGIDASGEDADFLARYRRV